MNTTLKQPSLQDEQLPDAKNSSLVSADELHHAFNSFNQISAQLTSSYQLLQQQVEKLSSDLQQSNSARLQELNEKERLANRLESLIQGLPGGVVVLDGQGRIQDVNPAAISLLGEPLHHQPWGDIVLRSFAPSETDQHDVSLVNGRRVNISTCPLGSEPGQILLLTDVTDMRALQDKLNHQQRLASMGEMAASLAHQIRTPLSTALLYASHLKRPALSESDRQRFGGKVSERLRYLESLIKDMLLFARGEHIDMQPVLITELLVDIENQLNPKLQPSGIQLRVSNSCEHGIIMANPKMLASAIMNLAENAIQALDGEGVIEIGAYCENQQALLFIRDNGPGISKQKQEEIFNPFFTTRNEGTGLGLAVVKAIVDAHHGDIVINSQQGEGSTFVLRINQYQQADTKDSEMLASHG